METHATTNSQPPSRVLGGLFLLSIGYVFISEGDSKHALVPVVITAVCMAIAEGIAWVLEGFGSD